MKKNKPLGFLHKSSPFRLLLAFLGLALAVGSILATAAVPVPAQAQSEAGSVPFSSQTSGPGAFWSPQPSFRLIVELTSPSLAEAYSLRSSLEPQIAYFGAVSPELQLYTLHLQNEHRAFRRSVPNDLPIQLAGKFSGEAGSRQEFAFDLIKNAVVIESTVRLSPGQLQRLESMPQVKFVHSDLPVYPQLYAGPALIHVSSPWQNTPGGRARAGQGVLIASIDAGLHKDAPMFSGEGFEYPAWMPKEGLGITRANNGKIVVSRTYFRDWDPPVASDHFPWPGSGTSHGVHTGAIAGGNIVNEAVWDGLKLDPLSGIAPGAWLGNYRVMYQSEQADHTFFTAEGVLALEDAIVDGVDVIVGAWGIGPSTASTPNDFLDSALINTTRAGVYVVMAAGNYGPLPFSVANPSDEYLTVGAVSTSGYLWEGHLGISDPAQPDSLLARLQYAPARLGPSFPPETVTTYSMVSALSLNAANAQGCQSWEPGSLDENMLLVARGQCTFAEKVAHANQAGAAAVIVYNHAVGGNRLLEMVKGQAEFDTPLPSLFVGHSSGLLLESLAGQSSSQVTAHVSTVPEQVGNQPFVVPDFSGRGPTVYGGLKPDVVAPGVHILSQGYGAGSLDNEKHLGYGQETGTSMAAPFVAGAVALIKEQHPHWTNDMITSAIMSTAQYEGISNSDGSVAQPTDMGAGLVDVERALSPEAFLIPPRISFGRVRGLEGPRTQVIEILNANEEPLTYDLSAEKLVGPGREPLHAFQVEPSTINVPPRDKARVTVTLLPEQADIQSGYVQGYLVLRSGTQELHAPLFAWLDLPSPTPEVLLLDADMSPSHPDYASWYTEVLDELDVSYSYWDASRQELKIPPYVKGVQPPKSILIFTGDSSRTQSKAQSVPVPFAPHDLERLADYVAAGGTLLVMGREAASYFNSAPLQAFLLGKSTAQVSPELTIDASSLTAQSSPEAPAEFQGLHLDLRTALQSRETVDLQPQSESQRPSDANTDDINARATFKASPLARFLEYNLVVTAPLGTGISDAWFYTFHEENPTRVKDLLPGRHVLPVFGTWLWQGRLELNEQLEAARAQGQLHLAVSIEGSLTDVLDAQVPSIDLPLRGTSQGGPIYSLTTTSGPEGQVPFLSLQADQLNGPTVAGIASDLSLDPAYTPAHGRTVFTMFGLEQIKETPSYTSRTEFLRQVLEYFDEDAETQDG